MPKGLTAKAFFDRFVCEMTVEGRYVSCEKKNSQFTMKVKNAIEKIICDTPEYYTVDHTEFLYDEREEEDAKDINVGFNPHKWALTTLVEHENDDKDWNYEVYKLAPFHCPLRVIIGYIDEKLRNDPERGDNARLNRICENFLFMKEQECFYGGGQFLVIIGNSRTWEKANYKGYLYLEEENTFYEILQ